MIKLRKRKKTNWKKTILIIIASLAIIYLGYRYIPDLIDYIKGPSQKSKNFELYKDDLSQYSVFGIDVSQYQKDIDFETLFSEQSIDFVIIRATAGKNNSDKKFKANWKGVKANEVIRGAYHYYRPDESSETQAKFFIKHVKLQKGDLPPILDIEKYSRVQSINSLKKGLLNWLKIVEAHYGVTPILYTYNSFYVSTIADDARFDKYPVWIAWYNIQENPNSILQDWVIWQFTDKGQLKGIEGPVDINVFNGKKVDLNVLRVNE